MGIRRLVKRAVKAGVSVAADRLAGRSQGKAEATREGTATGTNESNADVQATGRQPVGAAIVPVVDEGPTAKQHHPKRRVIYPKEVSEPVAMRTETPSSLTIHARPSRDNRQCDFLCSQDVLAARSWRFPDVDSGQGSPLAEALFAHPEVAWLQVDGSIVKVARRSGKEGDWRPLSERLGRVIREHMSSGSPAVDPAHFEGLPDEATLTEHLERIIEDEINPGVAAHDGHVTLEAVRGNTVHLRMGGGCQGCSAAALTLKFGIAKAFRDAIPQLGAIYDETDHQAGLNPYHTD